MKLLENDSSAAIYLFPYLNLKKRVDFGPWSLLPAGGDLGLKNPVLVARLEKARSLAVRKAQLGSYKGTLVARTKPELGDTREKELERGALAQAVAFATVAANCGATGFGIRRRQQSQDLLTAENARLLILPVAVLEAGRTLIPDMRLHTSKVLNLEIADGDALAPPPGLVSNENVELDHAVLQAVFSLMMAATTEGASKETLQLRNTIHWFLRAWSNGPEDTEEDAVVYLKTALEALGGSSSSKAALRSIEPIYRSVVGTTSQCDFLYDPEIKASTVYKGKEVHQSDFARWYWVLADARNSIIHDTMAPDECEISISGSRFNGRLWDIAERVVRELILIRLAQFGSSLCALTPEKRRELKLLEQNKRLSQVTLVEKTLDFVPEYPNTR